MVLMDSWISQGKYAFAFASNKLIFAASSDRGRQRWLTNLQRLKERKRPFVDGFESEPIIVDDFSSSEVEGDASTAENEEEKNVNDEKEDQTKSDRRKKREGHSRSKTANSETRSRRTRHSSYKSDNSIQSKRKLATKERERKEMEREKEREKEKETEREESSSDSVEGALMQPSSSISPVSPRASTLEMVFCPSIFSCL